MSRAVVAVSPMSCFFVLNNGYRGEASMTEPIARRY